MLLPALWACASAAPQAIAPANLPAPAMSSGQLAELEQETAPYRRAGTASISGQVRLDTTRGRIVAGDGTQVVLTPAVRYAVAAFESDAIAGDRMPARPPGQLAWTVGTDAEGRFTFRSLPGGDYLIASAVSWNELGPASPARVDVATARVSVPDGGTANVEVLRTVMIELDVRAPRADDAPRSSSVSGLDRPS
ncbi:MAG TPA: hypothetical protein VFD92_00475 [Candidatus Binatia bacterium]|nr:hypothetical protein [Candidatus Binatia bacterium]